MHIRETIDTVHDFTTGKTASMLKHKPVGPAMGKIAIELFDENGNLEQKADINNIAMDCINLSAYRVAYNRALTYKRNNGNNNWISSVGDFNMPLYLSELFLTDWDKPEFKNTPFVCGKKLAFANISDTSSGSSTTWGTYNSAESCYKVNEKGQLVMKHVFDWPTHAGNGTFRSVWLGQNYSDEKLSTGECFSISSLNELEGTGWPANLKRYLLNTGYANGSFNKGNFVIIIEPTNSSEFKEEFGKYYILIEFEGLLGKFVRYVKIPQEKFKEYFYSNSSRIVWRTGEHFHILGDIYKSDEGANVRHLIVDFSGNIVYSEKIFDGTLQDDNGQKLTSYGVLQNNSISSTLNANIADNIAYIPMYSFVDGKYYNYLVYYDCINHTFTKAPINDMFNKHLIDVLQDRFIVKPDIANGKILQVYSNAQVGNYSNYYMCLLATTKNGVPSIKELVPGSRVFKDNGDYYRRFFNNSVGGGYTYKDSYGMNIYYTEPFFRAGTHSLLPSPVTKKPSNTMKVTYEIIVDILPQETFEDFEDFIDKNL